MSCLMTKVLKVQWDMSCLRLLKVKAPPVPARGASSYVGREMRENTQVFTSSTMGMYGHLSKGGYGC